MTELKSNLPVTSVRILSPKKKIFRLAQKSKSNKLLLYVNYISIKIKEGTKSESNFNMRPLKQLKRWTKINQANRNNMKAGLAMLKPISQSRSQTTGIKQQRRTVCNIET